MASRAQKIFEDYIRSSGLKETAQRNYVLDAFLATDKHVSVEDLHRILAGCNKKVGFATVYRTMKLMADCGLACEVVFDDGVSRFEHTLDRRPHHHLVCTCCRKIIEFESKEMDEGEKAILEKYGFEAHSHRYEIFGLCNDCRKKE